MSEKSNHSAQQSCDPLEHIRLKYPDTFKVFAKNCLLDEVVRNITKKSRAQKKAIDKAVAELEKNNPGTKYPHGQLFVVPVAAAADVEFHFMDDHETRNEKKKRFWNLIKRHCFGVNPFHMPEGKDVPVVNSLGEVFAAKRSGLKVRTDNGLEFQLDDAYKPPIPRVVLAHTADAKFHEKEQKVGGLQLASAEAAVQKTGGCHCQCSARCDFVRFAESLEKFVIPCLGKAITLRQLYPNHPNPFQHANQMVSYIIGQCPGAERFATAYPLASLCLMFSHPGLIGDKTKAAILVDQHL